MALNVEQQISSLVKDKKNILITFCRDGTGDAVSSALAMRAFLKSQGKVVDVICDSFKLPKQFSFLKEADKIMGAPGHLQKFILTIDVKDTGVEELSYDLKDEKLRVFITPKKGFLNRDAVRTAQTDFKYDLIFILDSEDLESLGDFYNSNTELFYKTPIINIDCHPGNENFGQINVVDITCVSTAEVLFDLLKKLGREFINEEIATALLTGIIAKTRSFKSDNVKPHTLSTASALMSMGADREKIVTNLYRTRSVSVLKLWGLALTHAQKDNKTGLLWSTITRDDFVRTGATETDLKDIVDELISNSPEAKYTLLLHEHDGTHQTIHGLFRVHGNTTDAKKLLESYQPQGDKHQVSFILRNMTLKQVEEKITAHLQKVLGVA